MAAPSTRPELVKAGFWWTETNSSFPAANINTDLFTHIFCAFADLDPATKKLTISASKTDIISPFSATIKQKNPDVKTILSIAGKPETFALMAAQSSSREAFINSSIELARKYNFDGLDLHWQFPSKILDMTNLTSLLNEWNDAAANEAQVQSLTKLLLVATVFYSPYLNSLKYPTDAMAKSLDWINVLSYDFYTPNSSAEHTGPAAALLNMKTKKLCGDFGIKQWISEKFPANAIVMGLPFYGWAWLLQSVAKHGLFAPTSGPATGVDGVDADGKVDYGSITKIVSKFSAKTVFDQDHVISYAYYGTNWIAYDDTNSITAKISNAKKSGLLGYFAWHIGADDEYATLANTASQQWDANA